MSAGENLPMTKIGIITYHSAYNFGSALQAYATQQAVNKICGNSEIVNYRLDEQNYFYKTLYRRKYGPKVLIKDLLMFPVAKARRERAEKYEAFFRDHFTMTEEVSEPEQVQLLWSQYDVMISGSDQIFSKKSHELRNNDWKYMNPYLLSEFHGRRISYASSLGGATEEDVLHIVPALKKFDALAFREAASAKRMEDLLQQPIDVVLDPTFLLSKEEWIEKLHLQKAQEEKYVLVYSLRNPQTVSKLIKPLSEFAEKRNCRVRMVTPFTYFPIIDSRFDNHPEYGPIDFLSALYNAEAVVTDSYHGTILAVNFNKDVYSISGNNLHEQRKADVLDRLSLSNRVLHQADALEKASSHSIDYSEVNKKIFHMREQSLDYLKNNMCM